MNNPNDYDPPLSGVRIVDLSTGPMTAVGRLLADLGAQVTVVRLAGVNVHTGTPDDDSDSPDGDVLDTAINRRAMPRVDADARQWADLIAGADILVENTRPGSESEARLDVRRIRVQNPGLVVLSISDFGRDNEFREWQATTPVLHALSSELTRSGIPGQVPLVPPARQLPYHVAAAQAAVLVLSLYLDKLRTGAGDLIDFAVLDGAMQTLDPPYGSAGTASAGVAVSKQERNWIAEQLRYPILKCADGYIRICLLAKRQWHGMFEWLGRPAEFADPKYDKLRERFMSPTLMPAIATFFRDKTRAELESAAQRYRVPAAAVLTLPEALRTDQIRQRGFLREVELEPGLRVPVPVGVAEIDGHRASTLTDSVAPQHRLESAPILADRPRRNEGLPLEGLRVLDLGVIVVGSDTGRLFGDLGADVVKIENTAFPDGLRGNLTSVSQTYAAGQRNKRSIGIDLRSDEGRALAHRLAAEADLVLTNFKPGVAATLGMDHDTLKAVNPGIVVVDSSAFGPTGPWATRMGYGPLVRAAAGFTNMWVYPEDPEKPAKRRAFCDTVTVYPDHVSARIGVLAALALLLRRERTGAGGSVSIAQSEVMLSHLAAEIAEQSAGATSAFEQDAPWGVFESAGDDQWVAVTVRGDADWRALCAAIGRADLAADPTLGTRAGRMAERARVEDAVRAWTAERSPTEAMTTLQRAGVPAGAALRAAELLDWDYYVARRAFREELHPLWTTPFVMENVIIHSDRIADPPLRQAPLLGEQTREIAADLLGLDDEQIEDLLRSGVLESIQPAEIDGVGV
ncbi:CoA transferase [Mycolicibacterium sp. A43C]